MKLINMLCLKAITCISGLNKNPISISEISYKVVGYYWNLNFDKDNDKHSIYELNQIKSTLISKYGIKDDSYGGQAESLLHYYDDTFLRIQLLVVLTGPLSEFSKTPVNYIIDEFNIVALDKRWSNEEMIFNFNS